MLEITGNISKPEIAFAIPRGFGLFVVFVQPCIWKKMSLKPRGLQQTLATQIFLVAESHSRADTGAAAWTRKVTRETLFLKLSKIAHLDILPP